MDIFSLFSAKQVYIGIPLVLVVWGLWRLVNIDPAKGDSRGPGILMLGGGALWLFAVFFVAGLGGGRSGYREIPPEEIACVNEVVRYVGSPPRERFQCWSSPMGYLLWEANGKNREALPKGMLSVEVDCEPKGNEIPFDKGNIKVADKLSGIVSLRPLCEYTIGCIAVRESSEWRVELRTLRPRTGTPSSCLTNSPPALQ